MPTATRITHLIVRLSTGGAEQSLYRLLRHTQGEFQHQVICFGRPSRIGRDIEALGVTVHWLDERRLGPMVLWRALSLLRREPPDILQGWMYYGNLLASWLGRKLPAMTRTVWNIRQAPADFAKEKWLTRWAMRRAAMQSLAPDLVIYNSHAGVQAHAHLGYNRYPHAVIGNGIDFSEFAPSAQARQQTRQHYGIGDGLWVAMVSRYHRLKGVDVFLSALQTLLETGCDAQFALAGPGMQADNTELAGLLRQRGLTQQVSLLGEISATAEFLPGLDVLVQASWREGTPNTLIEAMACGVLSVATRVGDTELILQDATRLVPPGDVVALAGAISAALEARKRADSATDEQRVGAERAHLRGLYDVDLCMQAYRDTYARLLGRCT